MDDDRFFCPDCHAEHREPLDAGLGHLSRCWTCVLLLEAGELRAPAVETPTTEIHIAA